MRRPLSSMAAIAVMPALGCAGGAKPPVAQRPTASAVTREPSEHEGALTGPAARDAQLAFLLKPAAEPAPRVDVEISAEGEVAKTHWRLLEGSLEGVHGLHANDGVGPLEAQLVLQGASL